MLYNSEGPVYCEVASKTVKLISQMSALLKKKKVAAESWEIFLPPGALNDGCSHQVTLQFNQRSVLQWQEGDYAVYLHQTANTRPRFYLYHLVLAYLYFFQKPQSFSVSSKHHTISSLSPLSSLTMKYTDTNLRSPSTPKTQLYGCPTFLPSNNLPANASSTVLPTAKLSLFPPCSSLLLIPASSSLCFLLSSSVTHFSGGWQRQR